MRKNKLDKLTQCESKRKGFYEKHFGKPRNKWVRNDGFFLGSGVLTEISNSKGYKAWLRVSNEKSIKKFIVCEFPADSLQEEQREWLKHVNQKYKIWQTKAPWASKSGRKRDLAELILWAKARYKELKSNPDFPKEYARFCKIQEELQKKEFGSIKNKEYSIERIKIFVYSKNLV